jgi:hypothetical protein
MRYHDRSPGQPALRTFAVALLALATVVLVGSPARAASLSPGGTATPDSGSVGGTLLDTLVSPFLASGLFSGTLTSQVYSGDPFNSFGGLTFVYQVENDAQIDTVPHDLHRIEIEGFGTFLTDVFFISEAGNAPTSADRPTADVVGVDFVVPHEEGTTRFGLRTDCPIPGSRGKSIISQGGEAEAESLSPLPEPSTLVLAVMGLVGLARFARRRE